MKKTTLILAFILSAINAIAQQEPPREGKPKPPTPTEVLARVTKDLNLTDNQQKQFKSFLDVQDAKPRPTEAERNTRGEKDRKEMDEKLKSILTESQYNKWLDIKSKRKPKDDKPDDKPRRNR